MYQEREKYTEETNRTGIPDSLLQRAEEKSGVSFHDVRVHYNASEPKRVGALAYTQGSNIYISPGQEEHLSHELGHVVQQKLGMVKPTTEINGLPVNDDEELEKEADLFL